MSDEDAGRHVIFVDGVCVLCHGLVKFLLEIDQRKVLTFATLQGETAATVLRDTPYNQAREQVNSVIHVRHCQSPNQAIYVRSTASLLALRDIGGFWRCVSWLRVIPAPLRDAVYALIARYRYRWFGKHTDACPLPSQDDTKRFLT